MTRHMSSGHRTVFVDIQRLGGYFLAESGLPSSLGSLRFGGATVR